MRALLTAQQVEWIAREQAVAVTRRIEVEAPLVLADFNRVRRAVEHDLIATLEGLMRPDEPNEAAAA